MRRPYRSGRASGGAIPDGACEDGHGWKRVTKDGASGERVRVPARLARTLRDSRGDVRVGRVRAGYRRTRPHGEFDGDRVWPRHDDWIVPQPPPAAAAHPSWSR